MQISVATTNLSTQPFEQMLEIIKVVVLDKSRPTPAAEKQLFARCFLRTEGWPAIRVDSSGQRLCRSRADAI
jgi:hypothetical protein